MAQLKAVYKDDADGIVDDCDTVLFLGGKSTQTAEALSKMVGKATVDTRHSSESRGQHGQYTLQNNTLGRDLIDPSEIGRLGRNECLVLISGLPPFRSRKIDPSRHARYRELAAGGAPRFDLRQALEQARHPAPDPGGAEAKLVLEVDLQELNTLLNN